MAIPPNTVLYFDTNALHALKFDTEISLVLEACKAGELRVYLSEWVIYEYARKWFVRQRDALISEVSLLEKQSGKGLRDILKAYHVFFKTIFEQHGVNIITDSNDLHVEAQILISNEDTYFSSNNSNDQRDALILASALLALRQDQSIVICQEKNLGMEFVKRGFSVRDSAKDLVGELSLGQTTKKIIVPDITRILREGAEYDFPAHFDAALQKFDPTYAELHMPGDPVEAQPILEVEVAERRVEELGEHDRDVRFEILAYVHWFAPVKKEDLIEMLAQRQLQEEIVLNNAGRLVMAESIRDTGTHFLPGRDGVCKAIGNSRVEEFIELLRAG